jgi:hypothetical protein
MDLFAASPGLAPQAPVLGPLVRVPESYVHVSFGAV